MSLRDIATQFNLDHKAIDRHKANHLPSRLTGAVSKRKADSDDAFLEGLLRTARRMDRGVAHAMAAIDDGAVDPELAYRMGPAYAAQASRARELIGQATGRLGQAQNAAGGINVNLQIVIPRAIEAGPAEVPAIDVQAIEPGDTPSE